LISSKAGYARNPKSQCAITPFRHALYMKIHRHTGAGRYPVFYRENTPPTPTLPRTGGGKSLTSQSAEPEEDFH